MEETMRTLTVSINESEYKKLGLANDRLSFSELKEKLSIEYAKEAVLKCHQTAQETGLSHLTLAEIDAEINAVRDNAANCH